MGSIRSLIEDARKLPHVPLNSAEAYSRAVPELVKHTSSRILSSALSRELTGGNQRSLIEDNHGNHAMFMSNVFIIGEYKLLARTLPWVYKVYTARGFSEKYFPEVVRSFMEGVSLYLPPDKSEEILTIYRWMLENHERLLLLSGSLSDSEAPGSSEWLQKKTSFLKALLEGDSRKCLEISAQSYDSPSDIEEFYVQVIQPAMYAVGVLWENNEISVAQEHLASAIVTRTIGASSVNTAVDQDRNKRVVVTACASEFHEIGAWMVSDHFEHMGWHVRYLGANTPVSDLMTLLEDFKPSILALSVTMSFNLVHAKELMKRVRENERTRNIKVLIGGRVINENPELCQTLGANGYAEDIYGIDSVIGGWDEPAR